MIIYMAQATPETSRMVGSLSGNPIPFIIPIILTLILYKKHPISFKNKNLYKVLLIYTIWAICSLVKYNIFTTEEYSYHFFMIYAILIAYIHNRIYGGKMIPIYENLLVLLSKISIILWLFAVFAPFSSSFFRLFPETRYGNSVIYLFTWMDPVKGQIYSGILRNAGCSWEPGRFAIMITLAIFCNLCQYDIKFKHNKNIWWLLIALATTQSTTGYSITIILYIIFLIKKINIKYIVIAISIMLPTAYLILQFDFMSKKIITKIQEAQNISRLEQQFHWNSLHNKENTYLGSIDRFDAIVFEWQNVLNDPLLGYSRNTNHSYFSKNITSNYTLANGLIKTLGMYGCILGCYFFYLLYYSSSVIAASNKSPRKIALFTLFCLSAISYQILSVPIFTSFWFYGYFNKNKQH